MSWQVLTTQGEQHVIPLNDLRPHTTERCWCRPTDDEGLWVHHAMDRREEIERGDRART